MGNFLIELGLFLLIIVVVVIICLTPFFLLVFDVVKNKHRKMLRSDVKNSVLANQLSWEKLQFLLGEYDDLKQSDIGRNDP